MLPRVHTPPFQPGTVWLVGAGPGDPGLLTLNAISALEQAEIVLYDSLVAPEILTLSHPEARLECVGKRAGRTGARQLQINQRLIERARQGLRVVRLKNGDPFVFGRGGEEALALAAARVPFRVVPGVSAGIAAPAYAGIPTTHRMLAQSVAFVTGHNAGGGPARAVDWSALAQAAQTLVLYMALHQLPHIAAVLLAAGRDPNEPVALLQDATTCRQRSRITTLAEVCEVAAASDQAAPTTIVIGPAVGLHGSLSRWQQTAPALAETSSPARLGGMASGS